MTKRARFRGFPARRTISVAACAFMVAGGASGCFEQPSAMPTVRDFLIAWQVGNYKAAARHTTGADREAVANALGQVRGQLDAITLKLAMGTPVKPGTTHDVKAIEKTGDTAVARFSVTVDLGENGEPWTYNSLLNLKREGRKWKVIWKPSIIHPELKEGYRLAVVSTVPTRAPVLDSANKSLIGNVLADVVGVMPGQLKDPQRTVDALVKATKIEGGRRLDGERLLGRVRSAPPERFLPLLTLERPEHNGLIQRLRTVPGLVLKSGLAPINPQLAVETVGDLGPATADRLQQVGAPYQPGDTIGVGGLQLLQQRRLAGTPTVTVVAQDQQGVARKELLHRDGETPKPVHTTLDRIVQPRAEAALSDLKIPASLVAIRTTSGEILAVANRFSGGKNLGLEGEYAPGLTFGIISSEALLNGGMSRNTKTDCPASVNVAGKTFTTAQARGNRTLESNFAYSCATTLAQLSTRLNAGQLTSAASLFGLGKEWNLTIPAFSGSVPAPANDADKAATMIGQGRVRVSPLSMALVAGAAATGTWRPPYLLNDPRSPLSPAQPLPGPVASELTKLMRRSVTIGTANGANVKTTSPVHGVMAVADQGTPGKTVSWFVGYRGDIAFAIAVEGRVNAAKLAARFLTGTVSPTPISNR
ncbi:penicillin-binding transpeptidase domain-containing protein [Spirillospora sp. CA-294931]|uniref:penicillin-binding transpeptidase domain-containing protein n=1 Tax=Spirillospora sp. CA-294931 TaxID=3240042 RepID=UPI003D8B4732